MYLAKTASALQEIEVIPIFCMVSACGCRRWNMHCRRVNTWNYGYGYMQECIGKKLHETTINTLPPKIQQCHLVEVCVFFETLAKQWICWKWNCQKALSMKLFFTRTIPGTANLPTSQPATCQSGSGRTVVMSVLRCCPISDVEISWSLQTAGRSRQKTLRSYASWQVWILWNSALRLVVDASHRFTCTRFLSKKRLHASASTRLLAWPGLGGFFSKGCFEDLWGCYTVWRKLRDNANLHWYNYTQCRSNIWKRSAFIRMKRSTKWSTGLFCESMGSKHNCPELFQWTSPSEQPMPIWLRNTGRDGMLGNHRWCARD